jgi:hypothetical protein
MRLILIGTDLPGRTFCDTAGRPLDNVHGGPRCAGVEPPAITWNPD